MAGMYLQYALGHRPSLPALLARWRPQIAASVRFIGSPAVVSLLTAFFMGLLLQGGADQLAFTLTAAGVVIFQALLTILLAAVLGQGDGALLVGSIASRSRRRLMLATRALGVPLPPPRFL